jgi:hypothetical protein
MTHLVAVVVLAAYGGPSAPPSRAAAEPAHSWVDVRLGDPIRAVQDRLGDPLRETQMRDGEIALRYLVHDMNALALVYERANRVIAIRLRSNDAAKPASAVTDPAGVSLADSLGTLEQKRGTRSRTITAEGADIAVYYSADGIESDYELHDGAISAITVSASAGDVRRFVKEPGAALVDHDGNSQDRAIVVRQPSEMTGIHWEYVYIAYHPCDGSTRWKVNGQSLIQGATVYDRIDVTCPSTGAKRSFFFDITAYFGK